MININLLRPLLVQGILEVGIPADKLDFKKWISSGAYMVRSVPSNSEIELEIVNDTKFSEMLAFDICRFTSASFETMCAVQQISALPKSFGWIAVKSYYAAFFAAHSMMRCFGFVGSQIEKGHVKLLNSYAQANGISSQMKADAGFYSAKYTKANNHLSLKKMQNTHEDTWLHYAACLAHLSSEVLMVNGLSSSKQQISADIDTIVDRLRNMGRSPRGNFLSQYRNAVNYRQEYDSWHPYGKKSIKSEKIVSFLSGWNTDLPLSTATWKESPETYAFFMSCREVIHLNYLVIDLILNSVENKRNIFDVWPRKLLNLTSAA